MDIDIVADAALLIAEFDAGRLEGYVRSRSAPELADFWVEYQFARTDWDCPWDDAECHRMFGLMQAQLLAAGLPA